jgi:ferric-dicitrate binding protein FerR (iron transport regulator)
VAIFVSRFIFPEVKSVDTVAMQSLYVPAGQRAEITLEDGTKVWLNANTTLTFPNQFSGETREVSINGEGYFDVVSNKLKPFIVKTNKYNVKVWGTKFNVMAYSSNGNFETALFEGSVEVLKTGVEKGMLIKPDQRIFEEKEQLTIAPITDLNHQLWKEGIISFEDESFTELVNKLQLYFDMKIEVKNDKILSYHCTGKFRTKDGVEHILKVLQLRNKFNYTIDEKTNTITIE